MCGATENNDSLKSQVRWWCHKRKAEGNYENGSSQTRVSNVLSFFQPLGFIFSPTSSEYWMIEKILSSIWNRSNLFLTNFSLFLDFIQHRTDRFRSLISFPNKSWSEWPTGTSGELWVRARKTFQGIKVGRVTMVQVHLKGIVRKPKNYEECVCFFLRSGYMRGSGWVCVCGRRWGL